MQDLEPATPPPSTASCSVPLPLTSPFSFFSLDDSSAHATAVSSSPSSINSVQKSHGPTSGSIAASPPSPVSILRLDPAVWGHPLPRRPVSSLVVPPTRYDDQVRVDTDPTRLERDVGETEPASTPRFHARFGKLKINFAKSGQPRRPEPRRGWKRFWNDDEDDQKNETVEGGDETRNVRSRRDDLDAENRTDRVPIPEPRSTRRDGAETVVARIPRCTLAPLDPRDMPSRTTSRDSTDFVQYVDSSEYAPFLSRTPIEPSRSAATLREIVSFFAFVESPRAWLHPRHAKVFGEHALRLAHERELEPNLKVIRRDYPLRNAWPVRGRPDSIAGQVKILWAVIEWIWGYEPKSTEVRWVVEKAPLPLFVLVLEYVSVIRFRESVDHVRHEFVAYLTNPLRDRDRRGEQRFDRSKVLVDWLEARQGASRYWMFFGSGRGATKDKATRTEEGEIDDTGSRGWMWWFDDVEEAGKDGIERTAEGLDKWERKMQKGETC
ncbi:hypothetical protein JCM10212_002732 [Sporobolomyces blumeae]